MKTRAAAIVASLCSAVLCFGLFYVPERVADSLSDWWAGFIFGVLVLSERDAPLWRSVLLVLASTALYWCAREVAAQLYVDYSWPIVLVCSLVGAVAAFALSAVVSFIARRRRLSAMTLVMPVVFGAAGGYLLALFLDSHDNPYGIGYFLLGYAVWQGGFAATWGFMPWWWRRAPQTGDAAPQPS